MVRRGRGAEGAAETGASWSDGAAWGLREGGGAGVAVRGGHAMRGEAGIRGGEWRRGGEGEGENGVGSETESGEGAMSPSAVMKGGAGTRDEGRDMSAMTPTAALSESARDRRPAAAGEGPGPAHKSLCQSLLRSPERRALRSPSGLGRGLSRSPGDVGRMAGCRLDMTGEEGAGAGAGGNK